MATSSSITDSTKDALETLEDAIHKSKNARRRSSELDDRLRVILQGYSLNIKVEDLKDVEIKIDIMPDGIEVQESTTESIGSTDSQMPSTSTAAPEKPSKKGVSPRSTIRISRINRSDQQKEKKKDAPIESKIKSISITRDREKSSISKRQSQTAGPPTNHRSTITQILRDLKVKSNKERLEKKEELLRNSKKYSMMDFYRQQVILDDENLKTTTLEIPDSVRTSSRRNSSVSDGSTIMAPRSSQQSQRRSSLSGKQKKRLSKENAKPNNKTKQEEMEAERKAKANNRVSFSESPARLIPNYSWNDLRLQLISDDHPTPMSDSGNFESFPSGDD